MRLLIIITIFFFLFLAFLGNINTEISNPFIAYLFLVLKTFVSYFPYFLIIFSVMFLYLMKPYLSKKHITLKTISHTLLQLLSITFIGIVFSFVILVTIAFLQLNIFSVVLNQNPKFLGVETNTQEIVKEIKDHDDPPLIITSDKDSQNEVTAIAKASSGINNFYGNKILSAVPDLFILPLNNDSNLLFLDNTLVVKKIDEKDMSIISPVIAHQIVKNYFSQRSIKFYPKISIMTDKSYKAFRQFDVKEKLSKVDTELDKINESITTLTEDIETNNRDITQNETDQREVLEERDRKYNSCLSEGTYQKGVFVPANTREFCQEIIEEWEDDYVNEVNLGKTLSKNLEDKQKRLKDYRYFNNYFTAQKQLIEVSSENIPSELGLFEQPNLIKIIISNSESSRIADYFNTLTHEYLHYASFQPNKRLESSFFEEGITEYFARNTIRNTLQTETNVGYPVNARLIEEISKRISEPDLAEIYFSKDQTELENKLNLVYGENFYKNNIVLFESLQYTSDPEIVLEIVNRIMRNIGSPPLKKEDLFSRESEI